MTLAAMLAGDEEADLMTTGKALLDEWLGQPFVFATALSREEAELRQALGLRT